jgi:gamma-glutamyltranspeptidase/glutathione hydrolase
MPTIGYSHRPVALGRRGMVASAHSYATVAGLDVLRAGGTAADAAVAVNAVLGVTQPENCGVGGDIFCLYYEAATGRVHYLNGSGRSGSRASLDELRRRGMDKLPVTGPATVSVPGCVRGWAMLLERFGTRPLGELLQPAIHWASRGIPMGSLLSQTIRESMSVHTDPEWRRIFLAARARRSGGSGRNPTWAAPWPTWPPKAPTSSIAGASVRRSRDGWKPRAS